jgi:probable HAF family extracellular repeat protein
MLKLLNTNTPPMKFRHLPKMRTLALTALLAVGSSQARDVPLFHLQDLGLLPGAVASVGQRINNRGEVAGYLAYADDSTVPFLYSGSQMIALGLPVGPYTRGFATDINSQGEVAGINRGDSDFDAAFLYSGGQLLGLSNVLQYPIVFRGVGINTLGALVGSAQYDEHGAAFAFIYQNGVTTRLPSLSKGGGSVAADINDAGMIIGAAQASGPDSAYHAVIYADRRITDLGTLRGGASSFGAGINEAGHAIGYSGTTASPHAFLYRKGRMIDLGILPTGTYSDATGINNGDQVVGYADAEGLGARAVLFMKGKVYDLNDLLASPTDLVLEHATDINDQGMITGTARFGAYTHAFRLTPVRRAR